MEVHRRGDRRLIFHCDVISENKIESISLKKFFFFHCSHYKNSFQFVLADVQFLLISRHIAIENQSICLTFEFITNTSKYETRKVFCNDTSKHHYWRWNDELLQHVATGTVCC